MKRSARFGREQRAGGQPHQIHDVGQVGRLIEIVDTPDEPSFRVPPRAEVLNMEVAHAQNLRSLHQIRTDVRKELSPAVKGRAEEGKRPFFHERGFTFQISGNQVNVTLKPNQVGSCRLVNILHWLSLY